MLERYWTKHTMETALPNLKIGELRRKQETQQSLKCSQKIKQQIETCQRELEGLKQEIE